MKKTIVMKTEPYRYCLFNKIIKIPLKKQFPIIKAIYKDGHKEKIIKIEDEEYVFGKWMTEETKKGAVPFKFNDEINHFGFYTTNDMQIFPIYEKIIRDRSVRGIPVWTTIPNYEYTDNINLFENIIHIGPGYKSVDPLYLLKLIKRKIGDRYFVILTEFSYSLLYSSSLPSYSNKVINSFVFKLLSPMLDYMVVSGMSLAEFPTLVDKIENDFEFASLILGKYSDIYAKTTTNNILFRYMIEEISFTIQTLNAGNVLDNNTINIEEVFKPNTIVIIDYNLRHILFTYLLMLNVAMTIENQGNLIPLTAIWHDLHIFHFPFVVQSFKQSNSQIIAFMKFTSPIYHFDFTFFYKGRENNEEIFVDENNKIAVFNRSEIIKGE